MIKYFISVFAIFFTLLLLAERDAVVYSAVPTAEQREANKIYTAFPGFNEVYLVKNKFVNIHWQRVLDLDFTEYDELIVRDFDVIAGNIILHPNRAAIPFSISIRYKKKDLSGVLQQGTINADGIIEIQVSEEDEFNVKMIRFDDSRDLEKLGREAGVLSRFNGEFVEKVTVPVVTNFFTDKTNQDRLVDMIQTNFYQH